MNFKYFLVLNLSVAFIILIVFCFLKCDFFFICFCDHLLSWEFFQVICWFILSLSLYFFVSSPKGLFLHSGGKNIQIIFVTITCMLTIHYWWTDSFIWTNSQGAFIPLCDCSVVILNRSDMLTKYYLIFLLHVTGSVLDCWPALLKLSKHTGYWSRKEK